MILDAMQVQLGTITLDQFLTIVEVRALAGKTGGYLLQSVDQVRTAPWCGLACQD